MFKSRELGGDVLFAGNYEQFVPWAEERLAGQTLNSQERRQLESQLRTIKAELEKKDK